MGLSISNRLLAFFAAHYESGYEKEKQNQIVSIFTMQKPRLPMTKLRFLESLFGRKS
jgi:hypothetical protein